MSFDCDVVLLPTLQTVANAEQHDAQHRQQPMRYVVLQRVGQVVPVKPVYDFFRLVPL